MKYAWYNLHSNWNDDQLATFAIRLQSTDIDGLNIPALRASYMAQYKNNLIGKHFKALMQTGSFHLHNITTPERLEYFRAVGALGSFLWVPEIDNMNEYTVSY